ncbi:MAG: discoidin domain-containing protein [Planctomycetes bacterium]|nr:discoidin domain-containing protein [Planctomycetota bacterium]
MERSLGTLSALAVAAAASASWLLAPDAAAGEGSISLDGRWRFQLDRDGAGLRERWFERALEGEVTLPGALPAQGIGDEVTAETRWTGTIVDRSWFTAPEYEAYRRPGNVKVPFWLQPERHYVGAAWYQREVEIPEGWRDLRVVLSLERPHWETRAWLEGRFAGSCDSLSTPHEHELGSGLAPGRHTLTVRVDNRLVVDVGENSHSVSDHTQGNWNGIVGRIELRATARPWIDDLQTYPRAAARAVVVKGRIGNAGGRPGAGKVALRVEEWAPGAGEAPAAVATSTLRAVWDAAGGAFDAELALGAEARLWDEHRPALYRLTALLEPDSTPGGAGLPVARSAVFGLRELSTAGTRLLINGRRLFVRGTLECAVFPRTGHPPADDASWKKVIGAAKDHGLNVIRFHSWCPPEAAFAAADELGLYLHVECASWANQSTTLGDGKPVDAWVHREADRILRAYGSHPSFAFLLYGNEPGGPRHAAYLAEWVRRMAAKDPRRLYSGGAGWPQIPENQFHVTPDPRIQGWGAGLGSRINARPPETVTDYRENVQAHRVPVVSHEIGQWCVYPSFDEIPKYTGYLKPRNFEIFRDSLRAHGILDQARDFVRASGKLQTLCYKEDIESALRTPGMGGFQLLGLNDFPGQGTALVGVLDPFWEPKGYVTAEEFRRFAGPTVPLALLPKRVFTADETLEAVVKVAHFGPAPLERVEVRWRLAGAGAGDVRPVASGSFGERAIPLGNEEPLGRLEVPLASAGPPRKLTLEVWLEGTPFRNDWDVWVYPAEVDASVPAGIVVACDLDDEAAAALEAGGRVLLLAPPARVGRDPKLGRVELGFSSIFWNTAWTGRQAPQTLGILCDPSHPLFAEFPTDPHTSWQWWYLVTRAGAMILDGLPQGLRPIVQVIDDWFTNRKLGLVFEARVGRGRLLVSSIDLEGGLEGNPVARQLRRSLFRYMASEAFQPKVEVTAAQVRALLAPPPAMQRAGLRSVRADSFQPGHEPENAVDGDPRTLWHTAWGAATPGFPHELRIELERPLVVRGLRLLPRQDGNRNGWIQGYAVHLSADGESWGEPAAEGTLPNDAEPKTVTLAKPAPARSIRLVALSGHAPGPWASLAELEVVE